MKPKILVRVLLFGTILAGLISPAVSVLASQQSAPTAQATPYDLIVAMNTLRVSNGFKPLVEDPIIDAVAQATAASMAASNMSWHIGNVSGRVQAAGYGGGERVWATENFSSGFTSLDQIMQVWSDPSHMLPATMGAYCNVGAGAAKSPTGVMYYVLQAAYVASKACGSYTSGRGATLQPGGSTGPVLLPIIPVKVATPDADGRIFHVVQTGQTLWAIAIAYKVTIKDLQDWNNMSSGALLIVGKKLLIPGSNTAGYSTPTPVGMVITGTPAADGKVIHVVQAYQNLTTISLAYGVSVDSILTLNGLQLDTPLQIGEKLVIHPSLVTPSPTARPLTPLEKLTPASDGKYYHTVRSGENLSSIAALYKIALGDLMTWNGLSSTSVLLVGQKLLLKVTPPATTTPTPEPATQTPTATPILNTATPTQVPSQTATLSLPSPSPADPAPAPANPSPIEYVILGMVGVGLLLVILFVRKNK